MDITWHLEKRFIEDLKPFTKNPRLLTKTQESHLVISIDTFGLIDRPCINLDNTIIGGHQRIHVLKKLGYTEIEVMVPDRMLSQEKVSQLCIRLNKNTGDWDYESLANAWDVDDLVAWGFDVKELGEPMKLEKMEEEEEKEEEEVCPECNQKVKKKK